MRKKKRLMVWKLEGRERPLPGKAHSEVKGKKKNIRQGVAKSRSRLSEKP